MQHGGGGNEDPETEPSLVMLVIALSPTLELHFKARTSGRPPARQVPASRPTLAEKSLVFPEKIAFTMKHSAFVKAVRSGLLLAAGVAMLVCVGCPYVPAGHRPNADYRSRVEAPGRQPPRPIRPVADSQPIQLHAAQNEWTTFALQVERRVAEHAMSVRITGLHSASGDIHRHRTIERVSDPFDARRGDTWIRPAYRAEFRQPKHPVLLSVGSDQNGSIELGALRDPTQPTNPAAHPTAARCCLDRSASAALHRGWQYTGSCQLVDAKGRAVGASLPLTIHVYDLPCPSPGTSDGRQSRLEPARRLYPDQFGDTITPSLINRADPRYSRTISTLDQMMSLSEQRRACSCCPAFGPQ